MSAATHGTFCTGSKNATAGTAWAKLVKPWRGLGPAATLYGAPGGVPNWGKIHTHITELLVDCAGTANNVAILRALNYSVVNGASAKNTAVINLTDDPGIYSTNYKFRLPGTMTAPAGVADNGIAANDYVAYQLTDGTWVLDTVSSVSTLAITVATTLPNVTGGGVASGSIFWFFGVLSDKNPATGEIADVFTPTASTKTNLLGANGGGYSTIHPGSPMVVYCVNATARTDLSNAGGYYSNV